MAQLQNLHALPIVLAAVVAWFFGAAYYSLLCRKWLAAQGKTMEQSKAENADKSTAAKVAPEADLWYNKGRAPSRGLRFIWSNAEEFFSDESVA